MNSVDRHQSLANTFAVLAFLLVYGLAGEMDCVSERRMQQTRQPASSQHKCQMTAHRAGTFALEHSLQSRTPETRCTASQS